MTLTVYEGALLCGRYRLEKLIGNGGTADVYRAFDEERQAPVAIKVLHSHLAGDPDLVRRFRGEAEALAVLDHPNIVRLYALEETEDEFFIVLDYVPGVTLRDRLAARRGPFDLEEASGIFRDVCGAMHYAHRKGIVHQDIKPGNVILKPDGRAMLTDFGIARALGSAGVSAMTMGTPSYMSPEQIRGDPADAQSDIYSLGVVLYEMVAGRRPFTGGEAGLTEANTTDRLHEAHLWLSAPDPCTFNPKLPPQAGAVVLRALAKRSRDRWPDVLSLRQAWEAALGAPLSANEGEEEANRAVPEPPTAQGHRKTAWAGLLVLGTVVALAAVGLVAVTLLRRSAQSASTPARSPVPATAEAPAATSISATGGVVIAVPPVIPTTSPPAPHLTVSRAAALLSMTPTPTLIPTNTPEPGATLVPTATAAPTRPPATATRAVTGGVRTPGTPIGGVTLVAPPADATLQGRATFEWRNDASFALGLDENYELLFWLPGQDGLRDGRSPVGASSQTTVAVEMAGLGQLLGSSSSQLVWGVRLWGASGAVRMLSEGRSFNYTQSGGGNAPPPPPPQD